MVGIDISNRSIKLVRLSDSKMQKVFSHCTEVVPKGVIEKGEIKQVKTVQSILQKMFKTCQISPSSREPAAVSIPETQSFLRVVEIPMMAEDEIGEAVRWEVAQHIPFGLENVYIDWQPLTGGHRPASGRQEVLVGAAQKQVVDPLYQVVSALGFDIAAFELESQAIVRALISEELRHQQGILIIDLGASATNVVIHDHGTMRFTASMQRGIDSMVMTLPSQEAREVVDDPVRLSGEEMGKRLQPAEDELVMEVRGIVEFYNSIDAQHEVKEIILAGGGSTLPGLDKAFLRHFDEVHVQQGNPWVNILSGRRNVKLPLGMRESVRFTTAVGLALRPVRR